MAARQTPATAPGRSRKTPEGALQQIAQREIGPDEGKKRARALRRYREMDTEYTSTWEPTHQDIIDFVQPNHGQFTLLDTNDGTRKDDAVLNNYATDKAGKLSAAIDIAVFSEAREWWVPGTEDPSDMEDEGNREYLHSFQEAMFAGLSKVGFYAPNRNAIDDTVGPATGLVLIEEDEKNVARCTHVPPGQYRVACDARGEVNCVVRRFIYTAAQMVEEFGIDRVSIGVKNAMSNQTTQSAKFTVLHLIEERDAVEREYGKIDAQNMPWCSTWLEMGQGYNGSVVPGQADTSGPSGPNGILRESGYNEQPFYCYRWNTIGQNAYGTDSPGWKGLGDAKQLQDMEFNSAMLLALLQKPPMNRPDELANASLLPGADNPIPTNSKVQFTPSYVPLPEAVTVGANEKRQVEQRLDNTFFGNILFVLTGNMNPEPKTAEEIRGIKEERILQLGSVAARMYAQARIALRRLAAIFFRAGMLPTPPDKLLQKGRIRIDFINPLVSAQKAIAYNGLQQVISTAVALATARKNGADQLDDDEILIMVADMLGVNPKALKTKEILAQARAAIAEQQNAAIQAKSMPEAAGAINDLSKVDGEKLRQNLQQFSPNTVAQGTA